MPTLPASRSLPNLTGHLIDDGRFQLLDVLGSGAFGVVYRAVDNMSLDDELVFYAVKCLLRSRKPSDGEAQLREFSLQMSVCDHPNILSIHDVICDDVYIYVIMDYCPGGDLFGAITERCLYEGNIELLRAAFLQLIDAVHACHERGVFHRDLKPENILCSEDGSRVFLSDFGLATRKEVCRDFGCGSVFYMSPECIGSEIKTRGYSTRRSDIWSLGIILANMITGRNPWRYALTKDKSFSAYIYDRSFLRDVLPISKGANRIFNRIFTLNPLHRITLPELRTEILKLDTFFRSGPEIIQAPTNVSVSVKTYGDSIDLAVPDAHRDVQPDIDNGKAADSEERYIFPSPGTAGASRSCHHDPSVDITEFSATNPSNGGTSGDDSDGPITPETFPVDPGTAVPDLPDGEHLDELLCEPPGNKKHRGRRVMLLRRVVHRIMAM